jgi:hypothetical protein
MKNRSLRELPALGYPFLASAYFVLALAAHNNSELIPARDLLWPFAISLGVCGVGWVAAFYYTRDAQKSALITILLVVAFSSFGYVAGALFSAGALERVGGEFVILLLFALALAGPVLGIGRSGRSFEDLNRYLALVALMLTGYNAFRFYRDARISARADLSLSPLASTPRETGRRNVPDIYLIVLDKYTSSRTLASQYGYDNSDFERFLRTRGFVVPTASNTNYVHTFLSLASILNYQYLDTLSQAFGIDNESWALTYPMVERNRLALELKANGYRFVFFPTAFGATRQNRYADAQLPDPSQIRPEFVTAWLYTTMVPAFHRLGCALLRCQVNRFPYVPESAELLDWKFNRLEQLAGGEQPLFVFAHLTLPHEPYIYRPDCEHRVPYWPLRDDGAENAKVKAAYVDQIVCLNRKLMTLVDSLQQRSRIPPVILLQADHGHGRLGRDLPGLERATADQIADRISVFGAYALPGVSTDSFSDSITPVNVVRLVLRHYLRADLPPLQDATYWSAHDRPYRFVRVR